MLKVVQASRAMCHEEQGSGKISLVAISTLVSKIKKSKDNETG